MVLIDYFTQAILSFGTFAICLVALGHIIFSYERFFEGEMAQFIRWLFVTMFFITLHVLGDAAIALTNFIPGWMIFQDLAYLISYVSIILAVLLFIKTVYILVKISKLYGFKTTKGKK